MTTDKTYIQIPKAEAMLCFMRGQPVKLYNDKTGKIKSKNATKEDIFDKNYFYFIKK